MTTLLCHFNRGFMINVQQVLIMDVRCVIDEYWSICVVATCLVNILPNILLFDVKQVNSVIITVLQSNMVLLITICIVSIIDVDLAFYRIVFFLK